MSFASGTKIYGLSIPKSKDLKKKAALSRPSVFGDDDDDDDDDDYAAAQMKAARKIGTDSVLKRKTQLEIDKALEEDPSVYEYDAIYDDIQEKKATKIPGAQKEQDKKPKYIKQLLKTAELRKKEYERREEHKVQKEREQEQGQFTDKETFVTSSYRKKMEEMAAEEENERRQDRIEAMLDVTKQKDLSGFYRHFLKQTTGEVTAKDEKNEKDEKKTEVDFSADRDATDASSGSSSDSDRPRGSDSPQRSTSTSTGKQRHYRPRSPDHHTYRSTSPDQRSLKSSKHRSKTPERQKHRSKSPERRRRRSKTPERRKHRSKSPERRKHRSKSPEIRKHRSRTPEKSKHKDKELLIKLEPEKAPSKSYDVKRENESESHLSKGQSALDSEKKEIDFAAKFPKRNTGDSVNDAKARYLARKQNRHIAISVDNDA